MTSERLGRIVEESLSEVYLFSAEDFRFVLVNRGARENLGFSMEELRGQTPWDIKPEFDRERFVSLLHPLMSGRETQLYFETVHERKDSSRYDAAVHLQIIRTDGDEVFFAAVEDVTERNRTEAALKRVTERLDAILSNTTMAVFMMDERQRCTFMNNAAEELTGYMFEEVRGRTLHDVIHHSRPDGRPFPIEECAIDRALPENSQTQGEEVFVRKDGSYFPVGFSASPMHDDAGRPVGTVIEVRDITEELKARQALQRFNTELEAQVGAAIAERDRIGAQLVQAQKMEAVGQLTGGIAHDFNNLLQVIGSNLQLLEKDLPENDPRHQRVRNALYGVNRGAKLASQLLAFGRQQPLEPKPINLARLIRGMDDMLRRTLGEAIEVETVICGGLWNCIADPAQVENMILNLAINARDAMDHRGKLTIEAGNASLDDAYASQHAEVVPGQYLMLAVTDTGGGIPKDVIGKVFDPFFTTKAPGEGTGLGLSMVYGFVKQSGGHVNIYSEEGHGTTVRIYLPRTRQEEQVEPVDPGFSPTAIAGEMVLVVEDDDEVRATAIELLGDLGYSVVEAPDADSGLAIVNSGLKIDLLFCDVVMPGAIKSTDLARKAKERLPDIAVLFTSGYTQNAIVHSGRLDDGVELISKPYTRERLAQRVRGVLDGRPGAVLFKEPAAAPTQVAPREDRKLRILLVEDEALVRMATADILTDLGHHVLEAGKVGQARGILAAEQIDVMLTDIGLPDGSGEDLVRETLDRYPDMTIIVASGSDAAHLFTDEDVQTRVRHLTKPFGEAALLSILRED
jgi:PAS domain S-box-containing protein